MKVWTLTTMECIDYEVSVNTRAFINEDEARNAFEVESKQIKDDTMMNGELCDEDEEGKYVFVKKEFTCESWLSYNASEFQLFAELKCHEC